MPTIPQMLQDLREARNSHLAQLKQIDSALAALAQSASSSFSARSSQAKTNQGTRPAAKPRRRGKLSAAGRARIAAAQKLRWAKLRAKKK